MEPMLADAIERFLDILRDPRSSFENQSDIGSALWKRARASKPNEREETLRILGEAMATLDPARGARAAGICEFILQDEDDIRLLGGPLVALLRRCAITARALFIELESNSCGDWDSPERAAKSDCFRQIYFGFHLMEMPLATLFSIDHEARAAARDIVPLLQTIDERNESVYWTWKLIEVRHNDPYVALEPATGLGIVGRMSGISSTEQLQILLMDIFPHKAGGGWPPKPRVSQPAVRQARRSRCSDTEVWVRECWNLYPFSALRAGDSLPDDEDDDDNEFIWQCSLLAPAEFPVLEGHRVILLGPTSYRGEFRAECRYGSLKADLTLDETLSREQVRGWIAKIARANAGSR